MRSMKFFRFVILIAMVLSTIPCKAQSVGACVYTVVGNVGCMSKGCTDVVQVTICSNAPAKTHCYPTGTFFPCCSTNIAEWATGYPCGGPKIESRRSSDPSPTVLVTNGQGGFDLPGPPSCSVQ
jgi:hypothetical protein